MAENRIKPDDLFKKDRNDFENANILDNIIIGFTEYWLIECDWKKNNAIEDKPNQWIIDLIYNNIGVLYNLKKKYYPSIIIRANIENFKKNGSLKSILSEKIIKSENIQDVRDTNRFCQLYEAIEIPHRRVSSTVKGSNKQPKLQVIKPEEEVDEWKVVSHPIVIQSDTHEISYEILEVQLIIYIYINIYCNAKKIDNTSEHAYREAPMISQIFQEEYDESGKIKNPAIIRYLQNERPRDLVMGKLQTKANFMVSMNKDPIYKDQIEPNLGNLCSVYVCNTSLVPSQRGEEPLPPGKELLKMLLENYVKMRAGQVGPETQNFYSIIWSKYCIYRGGFFTSVVSKFVESAANINEKNQLYPLVCPQNDGLPTTEELAARRALRDNKIQISISSDEGDND
jgi:hypothetical protein